MSSRNRVLKHMLQWLIAGSRGGPNRARLIIAIRDEPMNANQLCDILEVDYRTVRHHLDILEKNGLVTSMYGDFEEIWNRIGNNDNNGGEV